MKNIKYYHLGFMTERPRGTLSAQDSYTAILATSAREAWTNALIAQPINRRAWTIPWALNPMVQPINTILKPFCEMERMYRWFGWPCWLGLASWLAWHGFLWVFLTLWHLWSICKRLIMVVLGWLRLTSSKQQFSLWLQIQLRSSNSHPFFRGHYRSNCIASHI